MAFLDDVVDWITSEVTEVSLHTADPGAGGANEYAGAGYSRQVPSWDPSSGGVAALVANLAFDGEDNDGPITHVGLHRAGGFWVGIAAQASENFNSDGRLDVSQINVTEAFTP